MKTLSKLLVAIAASFPVLGIAIAMPAAVQAQLASQTTTFSGDVPGTCQFDLGANQNVSMSPSGATLSGTSSNIGILANGSVNVALADVTMTANPANTTPAPTATLNNVTGGAAVLGTATPGNNMGSTALNNSSNQSHNVTIGMAVTGATLPGTYTTTVVLQCLTP